MKLDRAFLSVLACFFLSGFAALLYQTAWTRQFAFVFGTSELAIATVLAAYMGGLAAGAAIAGRLVHRVTRPVLVYGLLELGVALSALAVPALVGVATRLCVVLFGGHDAPPDAAGSGLALFYLGSSFVILAVPTGLMGATLPLLTRYAVRRDEEVGSRVGALYATNTLGAVSGTLVAGFALLPTIGLSRTVLVGVAANALVFVIAALLARRAALVPVAGPATRGAAGVDSAAAAPEAKHPRGRALVLPIMALSGAASFAYEVEWTRLLGHVLGGSVYAFATMLASFLTGIVLGSAVAARLARTPERSVRGLAACQVGIAALSLAAFHAVDRLPEWAMAMRTGGTDPLLASVLVSGAVLLPSTLFIGATFPFAVRILAREGADAPAASARVYAWNTVGGIAGAVGAGFFVIPLLGFERTLVALALGNVGLALATALLARPLPRWILGAAAAAGVAVAVLRPGPPWNVLRYYPVGGTIAPGEVTFSSVGRSSTVVMLDQTFAWQLLTNGLPEALIRKRDQPTTDRVARWLAALPVLVRPEAESLLVVGFGGGRVLEDVPASVERIDAIELEPDVIVANEGIGGARWKDPLADPRVHVHVNDARGALLLTDARWDAIVSQPSHPWTAGASHLYTREFFELVEAHLVPGGVFVQWIGLNFVDVALTRTLVATLLEVFPHVRVFRPPGARSALLFAGSDRPLDAESSAARALASVPADLEEIGIFSVEDVAVSVVLDEEGARAFALGAPPNTDERNLLQTRSPRLLRQTLSAREVSAALADHDPLARLLAASGPELDPGRAARRLLSSRQAGRVRALAQTAPSPTKSALFLGLLAADRRSFSEAAAELERAAAGSDSDEARAALLAVALATGDDGLADRALSEPGSPRGGATLREARRLAAARDWSGVAALDADLARVGPRDPLYADTARLRVQWRLRGAGRAESRAEAPAIARRLSSFTRRPADMLLRARALAGTGDPETAVFLVHMATFALKSADDPGAVVRSAARILASLPETPELEPLVEAVRKQLESIKAGTEAPEARREQE